MEELHSNLSEKLIVDDPRLHLKLDFSLKNKLIKKLNENSQLVVLTDEQDRMKTMEENTQMIATNQDALKFLKEIDYIKRKLGAFDAKRHNIVGWFKRFEFYSGLFGWSDEQRVDGLVHLLENGLDRVVCRKEPKYELIKKEIINLVTKLVMQKSTMFNFGHLRRALAIFDENEFTNPERKYWLGCMMSFEYLVPYVENFFLKYPQFKYPEYHEMKEPFTRLFGIITIKTD